MIIEIYFYSEQGQRLEMVLDTYGNQLCAHDVIDLFERASFLKQGRYLAKYTPPKTDIDRVGWEATFLVSANGKVYGHNNVVAYNDPTAQVKAVSPAQAYNLHGVDKRPLPKLPDHIKQLINEKLIQNSKVFDVAGSDPLCAVSVSDYRLSPYINQIIEEYTAAGWDVQLNIWNELTFKQKQ